MSQQAAKSKALVTTGAPTETETSFRETSRPDVTDTFSFTSYGWSFWNAIPAHFRKASVPVIKSPDEIARMHRDSIDALAQAGAIWTKGLEEIGRHILGLAHQSTEAHLATGKDVFNVRSLKDMADLHSSCMHRFLNTALAESIKLSELSIKIVTQASKPIHTHISTTLGKIDSPV